MSRNPNPEARSRPEPATQTSNRWPRLGTLPKDSVRPPESARWTLMWPATAYVAATVLSALAYGLVAGSDRDATKTVGTFLAGIAGLWAGLLGGVLLASRLRGTGRLSKDFGLSVTPVDVPIGIVVGVSLQLLAVPVISWPIARIWNVDIDAPARELLDITGPRWLLVTAIVVGAPMVEELFFRGLLLRSLACRFDDMVAIVIAASIFAASHFQPAQFPGLLVVGLTLCVLVRTTGRLGPAIIAHTVFNATAVWIVT